MLVGAQHDSRAEHNKLFVAGIGYVVIMALLIGLAIAVYQKAFTSVTWVTIKADRAGLQLPKFGDVRMHGVIVGQIRGVSQDGHQAVIKLGLDPGQAEQIPSNVDAEILPTTLFGQKYVQFVDPPTPAAGGLRDGTVIPADRVRTSVELESVLARLFPILQAVRPQDLNSTLTALSTALQGNGDRLGATITQLNDYLTTMNVHLPTLTSDIKAFADVAHTYDLAAPDLVRILDNATVTAKTVTAKQDQLKGLFSSVTGLSYSTTALLHDNEASIDTESQLAVPLVKLLADYSPEYPCLLKGLDLYTKNLNEIFRNSRVSQTMTLGGSQKPAYTRADRPEYGAIGHGPWCAGLPDIAYDKIPKSPHLDAPIKDGTEDDPAQHPDIMRLK
ncbi:MCE family protein [Nocardioides nematodiphilus]|uniref:MCE family protein n=1 Tax=Nocardioides nematodiphilus TaxID=2849669 RepID=UPI001CD9889A|nr:MCE family protein [Nocardioides nematodiphilus]MCA1982152.1 MCE family protein [Nocardioides nematodiphilus]